MPWSPAEVAADLRLLWLVDIGSAKAAELAGLSQSAFASILGVHRVSPFDLDPEELDREIAIGLSLAPALTADEEDALRAPINSVGEGDFVTHDDMGRRVTAKFQSRK